MQSTLNPKQKSADEVVVIAPDMVRVAPGDDAPQSGKTRPSDTQSRAGADASAVPPVDATFRATAVNTAKAGAEGRSFGKSAVRVLKSFVIAVVLAAGSGAIAYGWQNYGDTAREIVFDWLPQHVPTSIPSLSSLLPSTSPRQEASTPTEQPVTQVATAAPAVQPTAPDTTASVAQATDAPAPAAALSGDSTQLLQSMAHDLASLGQEIVQLKTSIEQLKASQEQMARELAKSREQNARPKVAVATPPMRPAAPTLPLRRPPPYPPTAVVAPPLPRAQTVGAVPPPRGVGPQAASPPPMPYNAAPPVSLQPDPQAGADAEDGGPVVRPPLPVR
jgi:hypothetical protein